MGANRYIQIQNTYYKQKNALLRYFSSKDATRNNPEDHLQNIMLSLLLCKSDIQDYDQYIWRCAFNEVKKTGKTQAKITTGKNDYGDIYHATYELDFSSLHISEILESNRISQRDRQILQLLAEGYNSKEVGEQLCMAANTVRQAASRVRQRISRS